MNVHKEHLEEYTIGKYVDGYDIWSISKQRFLTLEEAREQANRWNEAEPAPNPVRPIKVVTETTYEVVDAV